MSAPLPDPAAPPPEGAHSSPQTLLVGRGFGIAEHLLLIVIAAMTLIAAATEIRDVIRLEEVNLADILLMFLYTEVLGMVGVFYTGTGSAFVYPIFIAITALARLIVLQGKNMAPENIVFEASAILLLAVSAAIIVRFGRSK